MEDRITGAQLAAMFHDAAGLTAMPGDWTPVGAWIRVSSGGQDEQNQVPDVIRYCIAHRYWVVRWYIVHAKSAYKGRQQKDLDAALADMRNGITKILVTWHSDRVERHEGKALLDVLAEFSRAGGRVESVQEPTLGDIDFGGQVTTFITGIMNHEKSKHIGEQVTLAHDRIRANGAFSGRIPFGYTTAGPKYAKRLIPADLGRVVIPVAYDMIGKGKSLREVGDYLEEQTGKPWWANIVAEMIRRPVYRGHHQNSNGLTVHKCEALVDAAVWKRAVDSLAARPKRGKVYAENRAMLAGALTCPKCGGPMPRLMSPTQRKGQLVKVPYYRCSGAGAARKSTCRNMARVELVDAAVNEIIAQTLTNRVMIRTLIPGHDHSVELAELAYELQQVSVRNLSWEEEDAERARLRAEYGRVKALPSVPDQWEDVPNGHTYAGLWAELSTPERGAWLKEHGFTVVATKEAVTVSQGDVSATIRLERIVRGQS